MTGADEPDGLEWGIRAGFRDYLDALPDAVIELDGVERTTGGFRFPARAPGDDQPFGGRLRARAHAGALDLTLAEPRVSATPDGVVLTGAIGARTIAIARLLDVADATALLRDGGTAADVALTIEGSAWLGGVYGPWARMDPVHVVRRHPSPVPAD